MRLNGMQQENAVMLF